jgi:hypothetical protein
MIFESGKDYSFLLQAPGQLRELFKAAGVTLDHPAIRLPPAAWVVSTLKLPDGAPRLLKALEQREELIQLSEKDPFRYGYEPGPPHCPIKCWADARELLYSHDLLHITSRNRNTKTEFAAKEVVRLAQQGNKIIWCLCETEQTSKRAGGQQEVVWKYFPPEWKALNNGKRSDVFKVSYSPGGRFTDNFVIVPTPLPGKPQAVTEIRFMYYAQGVKIIEGGAIDLFWADEDCPVDWAKTLLYRLADRHGHGLLTYTPISGWNETYAMIYQGCSVVSQQPFPIHTGREHWKGCDDGFIPYVVQPVNPKFAGMFFPPDANPFVPFSEVHNKCASEGYEAQMIRLAGIAKKSVGNKFPKFGKPHILPASKIPREGTNYHFLDFAWERNWYQIWVRVVQKPGTKRRIFVYREWPDKPSHGEWAVRSGKPNGDRGIAQSAIGLGYAGYRDLILGLEKEKTEDGGQRAEAIAMRFGDPRSGRAPAITQEDGGTCNFDEMAKVGIDIEPAKGLLIGEGVNIINDLFDYDQKQYAKDGGRFTPLNEPQLFISEDCQNLIDMLMLWTGQGSLREQYSKEGPDLLRYMATEDLQDTAAVVLECRGGGAY